MEWLVETGDGEPLFHYPFKGWGRINSSNRRWMGVNIACKGIASFALQLIKDNVSEKWLLTRISSSAFLEDTGKSGKSRRRSRMLVRLLAEKREQRGVEKAFRRWRSPDSQEGNSKECNFPRMYFVLSIVSTMNFSSSDYEDYRQGRREAGSISRSTVFLRVFDQFRRSIRIFQPLSLPPFLLSPKIRDTNRIVSPPNS